MPAATRFDRYSRVRLLDGSTPSSACIAPRRHGTRLFVKRDDLMGVDGGGSKLRKLEFLLGEALAQGADTGATRSRATCSGPRSIHCPRGPTRMHSRPNAWMSLSSAGAPATCGRARRARRWQASAMSNARSRSPTRSKRSGLQFDRIVVANGIAGTQAESYRRLRVAWPAQHGPGLLGPRRRGHRTCGHAGARMRRVRPSRR
jgi:hypothetical protein